MRPANPKFGRRLPRRRKRVVVVRGNLSWKSRVRVFVRRWRWAVWVAGLGVLGSVAAWAWWYGKRHQWLARLSKAVDAVAWIAADPSYLAEILIAIFIVVVSLLVWLPKGQAAWSQGVSSENHFDRENEARKTLAQIIGGVLLLAGLYSSVRTFTLQERGQITDRYTKAIDQLGATTRDTDGKPKPNVEVRLGGIYALERITKDSPKDQGTILEVLTAYVRQNAPSKPIPRKLWANLTIQPNQMPILHADIQAILTVIGRRGRNHDPNSSRLNLNTTDLSGALLDGAHFEGANLNEAHFEWAKLREAHFEKASLIWADLAGADLHKAVLRDADLSIADLRTDDLGGADLSGAHLDRSFLELANLRDAHLNGAYLNGARLSDAFLNGADFSGANLHDAFLSGTSIHDANLSGAWLKGVHIYGADLSEAKGITQSQLIGTFGNKDTKLPPGLVRPDSWNR